MKIQTLILTGILAVSLASCEKDPDFNRLENDLAVYTNYDPDADFSKYDTYYMPDSILEVQGNHSQYWKDDNAKSLIDIVASYMDIFGYKRVDKKEDAKLGMQLTYLSKNTQIVTGNTYPGWWDFGFWGPWWGGWYYPYTVSSYSYNTNSFIMEMVDLTANVSSSSTHSQKLPVIWIGNAYGLQFSNGRYNLHLMEEGINRAFNQSQYLNNSSK